MYINKGIALATHGSLENGTLEYDVATIPTTNFAIAAFQSWKARRFRGRAEPGKLTVYEKHHSKEHDRRKRGHLRDAKGVLRHHRRLSCRTSTNRSADVLRCDQGGARRHRGGHPYLVLHQAARRFIAKSLHGSPHTWAVRCSAPRRSRSIFSPTSYSQPRPARRTS